MWRALFAGACHRFFRFTTALFISLLFTAVPLLAPFDSGLSALAQGKQDSGKKERVRFVDGRVELCEIVSGDEAGITLRINRVPKPVTFRWWQLAPEDAERLRDRLVGGPAEPPEGEPATEAERVRTHDGDVYEGIVQEGSPEGELWLKNARGTSVIRTESIATRRKIRMSLRRAYRPEEILRILVERDATKTPEAYDRLGTELLRAQLKERALAAFKLGEFLRHPERPEAALYRELSKLRSRIQNLEVRRSVFLAQERYLTGDYDAALRSIEAVEQSPEARTLPPDLVRELSRLRAQLQEFRGEARNALLVSEWRRTLEALLKAKAMDRSAGYGAARAYAETEVVRETARRVGRRLNFSPDDPAVRQAWERRPARIEKHSYDESSWIVLRPEVGDAAGWWNSADDTARYRLLKGIYVEKNRPILRQASKECSTCGGRGQVDGPRVCPACRGLKTFRVVLYR